MGTVRSARGVIRAAVLGLALTVVASGCQPGTPSLIPTASFQTAIDSFGYGATAPLWQLGANSSAASNVNVSLADPLAAPILAGSPDLWPVSGGYLMRVGVSTSDAALTPGTYGVGPDTDLTFRASVNTWEDRRLPIGDDPYEVRWLCSTASGPDVAAAIGTVTISQVTIRSGRVAAIALSWDLSCPRWINTPAGPYGGSPPRHWVGSATYNS